MSSVQSAAVWAVSAAAVGGILVRPRRTPEWIWAVAGAVAAAAAGAMGVDQVARAVLRGADVYAFLIGILCLAELARAEQLFDAVALHMLRAAGGSQTRLFGWTYLGGALLTALLSNDTTIVVLTPAVLAALKRTRSAPLPYLYICAFVANAASFLLPISNPANLVLFDGALPAVAPWLRAFGVAALAAVVLTFVALRLLFSRNLRTAYEYAGETPPLGPGGALTAALLVVSAVALVAAASFGVNVGYTALGAAVFSLAAIAVRSPQSARAALRHTTWSIVPLVAGLFVIVSALDRSGGIDAIRALLRHGEALGGAGTFLHRCRGYDCRKHLQQSAGRARVRSSAAVGARWAAHRRCDARCG